MLFFSSARTFPAFGDVHHKLMAFRHLKWSKFFIEPAVMASWLPAPTSKGAGRSAGWYGDWVVIWRGVAAA